MYIYTTPGLFRLWIHLFYFIILDSTCSVLSSEMKHFRAMVSDVNSVTIAMGSKIYYLLLSFLLIVTVITFYS